MSFLFTRAQWKHLALDGLRRELVRNVADVGAEVGVLRSWEARRAASVTGRVSSRPSRELLAPGRRAGPAQGAGAPHARRWRVLASQLHGRRRSRPALEHLGPGRRERSDRRTRRVAGMSTRDILGHHDGVRCEYQVGGKHEVNQTLGSADDRPVAETPPCLTRGVGRKGIAKLRRFPTVGRKSCDLNCTGCGPSLAGRATTGPMARLNEARDGSLFI